MNPASSLETLWHSISAKKRKEPEVQKAMDYLQTYIRASNIPENRKGEVLVGIASSIHQQIKLLMELKEVIETAGTSQSSNWTPPEIVTQQDKSKEKDIEPSPPRLPQLVFDKLSESLPYHLFGVFTGDDGEAVAQIVLANDPSVDPERRKVAESVKAEMESLGQGKVRIVYDIGF